MPNPEFHSAQVCDAEDFIADSFQERELSPGVTLVSGRVWVGDNGGLKPQTFRFEASRFSADKARAWLRRRGIRAYTFEPAAEDGEDPGDAETFAEIRDMEVFEAGTHRGREYTTADLDKMIANQRENDIDPPLVVGHSEDQALLQAEGLPAAGWLTSLKRVGKKLLASFGDVPRVVAEAIQRSAYKKRSVELYQDYAGRGLTLRRVALLGADVPEIKSLSDALAMYGENDPEFQTIEFAAGSGDVVVSVPRSAQKPEGEHLMPDPTQPAPRTFTEDQMKALTKSAVDEAVAAATAQFGEQITALTTERDGLKTESATAKEAEAKHQAQLRRIELERFCETLKADAKLAPAIEKMGVVAFMESLDAGEGEKPLVIEFGEGEEKVDKSQVAWFQAFLEALPKVVEFGEVADDKSAPAEGETKKGELPKKIGDSPVDEDSVKLHEKAEKFAEDHKVSYADALVAVSE